MISSCSTVRKEIPRNALHLTRLEKTFDNGNAFERYRTVIRLLNLEEERADTILLRALKDPDSSVRYAAAWAVQRRIGRTDPSKIDEGKFQRIIETALAGLSDGDPRTRRQMIETLIEIEWAKVMSKERAVNPDYDRFIPFSPSEIARALGLGEGDPVPGKLTPEMVAKLAAQRIASEKRRTAEIKRTVLDEPVRDVLLAHIDDPDPYVRAAVIRGLRLWEEEAPVKKGLQAGFRDRVWIVRAASFSSFFTDGEEEKIDIDLLKEGVRDDSAEVRRLAAIQLLAQEGPALRALWIEQLEDPRRGVVLDAVKGLVGLKEQRAVRSLLDLLTDRGEHRDLFTWGIEALTGMPVGEARQEHAAGSGKENKKQTPAGNGDGADPSRIIQDLKAGNPAERVSSALQLAWVEAPEAAVALLQALNDPAPQVRSAAVQALTVLPMPPFREEGPIVDHLLPRIGDSDPHVRKETAARLARFLLSDRYRAKLVPIFRRALTEDADPFVRWEAARGLSALSRSKEAGSILIDALRDEFPMVRESAARGIHLACVPEGLEPMRSLLKDPVPLVRHAAARQLQWADDPEADQDLKAAEEDPNQTDRSEARNALNTIASRRARREEIIKMCLD